MKAKNAKNLDPDFEWADSRPESTVPEIFAKIAHHHREIWEHDSRDSITEAARLLEKLRTLVFDY
jgi:hypothetical protein